MKFTKKQRDKAKSSLEWHELCNNGLKQISGAYVRVINLKIHINHVTYDVILGNSEEGWKERYNDVEMPIAIFEQFSS